MKKYLIFLLLLFLVSCNYFLKKKGERILARVFDEYLYESDLKGVIAPGVSSSDSANLARNFIDAWVRQQLVLHQAQDNLTEQQLDFSVQLENYRNSLTIFEYEQALVAQKLDTVVPDDEIAKYYNENQKNFLLKENIVQLQYVKLPLRSKNIQQFKRLIASDASADKTVLSEMAERSAEDYFLDDQNWLLLNDVLLQIPIRTFNQEEFLKTHRIVEVQDSAFDYIIRFRDFKIKDNVSPLDFEKDRIRNIILNKRKMDLISKMQQDVYNQAVKSKDFEVYE